jgi:hypothetical protein
MLIRGFGRCIANTQLSHTERCGPIGVGDLPILVAITVCQHKVWQFLHHSLSCGIHEIERMPVIWLDEFVFRRESVCSALAEALWSNMRLSLTKR